MKISRIGSAAVVAAAAIIAVSVNAETSSGADVVLGRPDVWSSHPLGKIPSTFGPRVSVERAPTSVRRTATSTSTAMTFVAGRPRQRITAGTAMWSTKVPRGRYNVSLKALISPTVPSSGQPGEIICGAIDLATLDHNTPWIYTADSGASFGNIPVAMSGAATILVRPTARPGLICVSPQGDFQLRNQIAVTYTRIKARHLSSATRVPVSPKDRKAAAKLFSR
jgi:hypothetical protein